MKEVALVIPAYNEEERISAAASALFSSPFLKEKCRFLFIVDGNDRTGEILENLGKGNAEVEIIEYPKRLGKGGAVGEGIKTARTKYSGFVDVDGHIPAETVEKALEMLLGKKLDCVICSRKVANGRPFLRRLASKVFNSLVNILFGFGISDTQCGCKFFKTSLAHAGKGPVFRVRGFAFDVELLEKIHEQGGKISEYKIGTSMESGGSFSLLESPGMLWDLLKLRFF